MKILIKKIVFDNGVNIYAVYEERMIGHQASEILITDSFHNKRMLIAEELFNNQGYEISKIQDDSILMKTPNLFSFSHKTGEMIIFSSFEYRHVSWRGR